MSQTLWDWDEVQFAMAVEEYDVPSYRPHPPGFPLFIALANIARAFAPSDFRALQAVTVLAAVSLFPLLFFLFRELRFPFATAWGGALLTMFVPNVWFYGGTGFSDVPALALTVAACAYLLRGARDRTSFLLGAFLLGLSAAMRPQALLVGAAPALVAAWKRRHRWRDIVLAIALGATTIAAAYAGAVLASSSYEDYVQTAAKLREYLRSVDSFLSPERPPLGVLFEFFFFRTLPGEPYGRLLVYAAAAGLLVTLLRREGRVVLLLLMFVPFQIFAWLMLDYHSVTRYGVMFAPMYAVLAAAAVIGVLAWIPGLGRAAGAVVIVLFAASWARWTFPALTEVRRHASPPVRAVMWLNENVPSSSMVYVHASFTSFARYFMGGRPHEKVESPADLGSVPAADDALLVSETSLPLLSAQRFVRGRGVLFEIARRRYFEVTVIRAGAWGEFGDGWHAMEWHGEAVWLWMGGRSEMSLPPAAGSMKLSLRLEPALEHGPPIIEAQLNGQLVERFALTETMEKSWVVPARSDGWNELVLTSDRFVNPLQEGISADGRDLSLRLLGYDWVPAKR